MLFQPLLLTVSLKRTIKVRFVNNRHITLSNSFNLINPECPAMRTFVPARVVVYIIHIPMPANIYIPGCTTSFPECFDIFGFLPLVIRHTALGKFLFNRLHSGFPFGGIAPVPAHSAYFGCIGITYL